MPLSSLLGVTLHATDGAVGSTAERSAGLLSGREGRQPHGPHAQQYTHPRTGGKDGGSLRHALRPMIVRDIFTSYFTGLTTSYLIKYL
jgi:hypothetical protein